MDEKKNRRLIMRVTPLKYDRRNDCYECSTPIINENIRHCRAMEHHE